jgi:hypothetical protein
VSRWVGFERVHSPIWSTARGKAKLRWKCSPLFRVRYL